MTRIRLVVTGQVEELALADSLQRMFPTAVFSTVRKDGFTSSALPAVDRSIPSSKATRLVDEMLAAGDAERLQGDQPFDFVVAVDDVELANRPDPELPLIGDPQLEVVTDHIAHAVDLTLAQLAGQLSHPVVVPRGKTRYFQRLNTDADRRRFLRERCSFHLLCPMVEALFFGEPGALTRAGAKRAARFDPSTRDVERFAVLDADLAARPDGWAAVPGRAAAWAKPERSRHPKHYLEFLCDPTGTVRRPYLEREGGRAALESLEWPTVLAHQPHACLARNLIVDIADMTGHPPTAGATHPVTQPGQRGRLRNLA